MSEFTPHMLSVFKDAGMVVDTGGGRRIAYTPELDNSDFAPFVAFRACADTYLVTRRDREGRRTEVRLTRPVPALAALQFALWANREGL